MSEMFQYDFTNSLEIRPCARPIGLDTYWYCIIISSITYYNIYC